VFDVEMAALRSVRALLGSSFNVAVELVVDTLRRRAKIVVVGIGKSGNIGRKIAATLTSTGSTSVTLNSVDALHGDLGIVNDGDLVLALSLFGRVGGTADAGAGVEAIFGEDGGDDGVAAFGAGPVTAMWC